LALQKLEVLVIVTRIVDGPELFARAVLSNLLSMLGPARFAKFTPGEFQLPFFSKSRVPDLTE